VSIGLAGKEVRPAEGARACERAPAVGGGDKLCAPRKLASLNRSWQGNKGTFRASGMSGIEPTPSESNDWPFRSALHGS
jgi:hypothetical protein